MIRQAHLDANAAGVRGAAGASRMCDMGDSEVCKSVPSPYPCTRRTRSRSYLTATSAPPTATRTQRLKRQVRPFSIFFFAWRYFHISWTAFSPFVTRYRDEYNAGSLSVTCITFIVCSYRSCASALRFCIFYFPRGDIPFHQITTL